MPDLLTARQSAALLADAGLPRSRARDVLAAGLAGRGIRTSAAVLYDAGRVAELADPAVEPVETPDPSWPDRAALAATGWRMSVWTRIWLTHATTTAGPLPFVATVSGYVCFAADLTGPVPGTDGATTDLALAPPGDWVDALGGYRLPSGPGHALLVHGAPWDRAPQHHAA